MPMLRGPTSFPPGVHAAPVPTPLWPRCSLHELAHEDCLGCCVLGKLALFYESKTKTRKRGGGRGGGSGGGDK